MVQLSNLTTDQLKLIPGTQTVSRGAAKTRSHALAASHQRVAALRLDAPAPLLGKCLRSGSPVKVLRCPEGAALQLVGLLIRIDGRKRVIIKTDRSGWRAHSNLKISRGWV